MSVHIAKPRLADLINLTPMIDCVFLLLIFFLVATSFEQEEREMRVSLPQASQAVPLVARPNHLFVNVDDRGHYYVGGQAMAADQLLEVLRQAAASNPGRQSVKIRADRRCAWQHVMTVMDMCNKAGIRDYAAGAAESAAAPAG